MTGNETGNSFAEGLRALRGAVAEMGGRAELQLAQAMEALATRNVAAARRIIAGDAMIDRNERDIEAMAIALFALDQPGPEDFREIVSALKISNIIERVADYAANVAKRTTVLAQSPVTEPIRTIREMARLAQQMVKDALDAYAGHDSDKAVDVWRRDQDVDEIYNSLFRELLTYMMENPSNITPCIHLMFIAKNIERIGDHATNLAEIVYFLDCGQMLGGPRPKSDITSFTEIEIPNGPDNGHNNGHNNGPDKVSH